MTHTYSARGSRQMLAFAAIVALHYSVFLIVLNDQLPVVDDNAPAPNITLLPPRQLPRQVLPPEAPEQVELAADVVREPSIVLPPFDDSNTAPIVLSAEAGGFDALSSMRGAVEGMAATLQGHGHDFGDTVRACYPAAARRHGEEGRLLLGVTIGSLGEIRSWRPVQSTGFPRLDAAAACVLDKLSFNAAREDGEAIQSEILLPITFRLD